MYLRAQRCWSVASKAQKRVMTRLRNQSEFTQTAEAGGDDCRAPDGGKRGVEVTAVGT